MLYRVCGDYILTQLDIENQVVHEDETEKISWGIDMHFPEPINAEKYGEAFRSFAYHRGMPSTYAVPYRCLYSKDIENLFIGGRLVSASHIAFSAIRVMRTLGMLGEVVGLAASICKEKQCYPRDIYKKYLNELKSLMKRGVQIPTAFAGGGIGNSESYHFKDIGWWQLHDGLCADNAHKPRTPKQEEIEKFRKCVSKLGIVHKCQMPKDWQ